MHGRVPETGLVGTWISFTSLGPEPVGRGKPTSYVVGMVLCRG